MGGLVREEAGCITVREATADDAALVLEHLRIVGGETDNLTFGAEGVGCTVEEEAARLRYSHEERNSCYFVALHGERIVGDVSLSGFSDRSRLAHRGELGISVQREFWGMGIGTRLMRETIAYARERTGIRVLSLEVRSDNERAIRLYAKMGFERVGTFKGFFEIGGDLVDCDIMQLVL